MILRVSDDLLQTWYYRLLTAVERYLKVKSCFRSLNVIHNVFN